MPPLYSEAVTHLMAHLLKLHRQQVDRLIRAYDVYPGQPPLLIRLSERDGQSQRELAGQLRVQPATLTVMINRMEKTGLVARQPDPLDQRVSRVHLTDKGRRSAEAVQEALHLVEQRCLAGVDERDLLALRRIVRQMHDNLAHMEADE